MPPLHLGNDLIGVRLLLGEPGFQRQDFVFKLTDPGLEHLARLAFVSPRMRSIARISLASFKRSACASSVAAARSRSSELLPVDIRSANLRKNRKLSAVSSGVGNVEMRSVMKSKKLNAKNRLQ